MYKDDKKMDPLFSSIHKLRKINFSLMPAYVGVTHAQFHILRLLHKEHFLQGCKNEQPGLKIGQLAKFLEQAAPTISQRVSELEKLGYIKRMPDANDRRITYVCLTDAGAEAINTSFENVMQTMQHIREKVGDDVIQEFTRVVDILADATAEVMGSEFPNSNIGGCPKHE
jgi:Transcriptional regulators